MFGMKRREGTWGGERSKGPVSTAKSFQGQDWTLKFHSPDTHFPSPSFIHKHRTPEARKPKQSW